MNKNQRINTILNRNIRIIPKLDIKGENLIKGVQLEGLRVIGKPSDYAKLYYADGADEIIYYDVVASLYGRNSLLDVVKKTAADVFIPMTVGGGIKSTDDVDQLLRIGADKVSVNTAAVKRPELITEIADRFGSQCCVVEIQTKFLGKENWTALYESGRENSGMDAVDWACKAVSLGAGELLLTSVDKDGTRSGMDVELINKISKRVNVPIIASGGVGKSSHVRDAVIDNNVNGIAIGSLFHYGVLSISDVKNVALECV